MACSHPGRVSRPWLILLSWLPPAGTKLRTNEVPENRSLGGPAPVRGHRTTPRRSVSGQKRALRHLPCGETGWLHPCAGWIGGTWCPAIKTVCLPWPESFRAEGIPPRTMIHGGPYLRTNRGMALSWGGRTTTWIGLPADGPGPSAWGRGWFSTCRPSSVIAARPDERWSGPRRALDAPPHGSVCRRTVQDRQPGAGDGFSTCRPLSVPTARADDIRPRHGAVPGCLSGPGPFRPGPGVWFTPGPGPQPVIRRSSLPRERSTA